MILFEISKFYTLLSKKYKIFKKILYEFIELKFYIQKNYN